MLDHLFTEFFIASSNHLHIVPFFHDKSNPLYDFDMFFQDDGARSLRYAPYSANTGMLPCRLILDARHFSCNSSNIQLLTHLSAQDFIT